MPRVDEGGFVVDYDTPPSTAIQETERVMAQVDAILASLPNVATFSRRLGTGLGGDLGETYHGDTAALAAEFILLLVLYERFVLPVIIIASSLLSTTAVYTALWLAGVDLNITARMGMTMVIGIATEMSIFFVSEYIDLRASHDVREARREASRNRLRPITMTTLAAILALSPLALAIGAGSGIQQPLAIAVIAGLLLQYPLVLLGMPVMIHLTERAMANAGRV